MLAGSEFWLLGTLLVVVVAVVLFLLRRGDVAVCLPDLSAARRVLEHEFDDVYVDRIGDLVLVKGRYLIFTFAARLNCAEGRYELSWPWIWPILLALLLGSVPGMVLFSLVLLVILAYKAGQLERGIKLAATALMRRD
ncbi:MAG: hypothetical protein QW677_09425 [Pyrobaculum sp.]|uniref:Uncharacterized protein n=2 Tax=Pyrobaculum arsenaticum TaxID=121277 RepID=A4WIY0_PYRAR|nr:hypothetical protein [Pyrobaculum arsenaticum]ABP50347.1 hypothetical protein Pars_0761 [Pyrobaculum arsenaticum DSM 13514]MCY0890333.1 hypothetical protein [Pyrobaculum arsenaticum]NYR14709.1 hypothetical protein [Pyrobaculum arsenaticum]